MCLKAYFQKSVVCAVFLFCIVNCYADRMLSEKLIGDSCFIASSDSIAAAQPTDFIKTHRKENKKLIAAILSFPFPFGIMGLHRIYLGTKPYIPFVYIGTAGGCFGILPMIDFITILTTKKEKFSHLQNSGKVFMWVR